MKFHDICQNTPEWDALRLGRFTASMFKDLFMSKATAGYEKAIYKVAFEKVTGESPESFTSDYMERGHEIEQLAKNFYENLNQVSVCNGGFFEYNEWVGASPDGLIGENGLIEIKSPAFNTMINYIITQKVPSQYIHQIQGQLLVTGREYCDFFAYHPSLKPVTVRVYRDEKLISEIYQKLISSIEEAKRIIEIIKP